MVAVDTNVLVRFLVRDDARQAARAASLIRDSEIWISKTVLLETEWVLRSLYGFSTDRLAAALRALAGLRTVFLEDEIAVAKALDWFTEGLDFANALHLASARNAGRFATFDRSLARRAKQTTALEIVSSL
jgi:predicted nucleic-acid-binding protein